VIKRNKRRAIFSCFTRQEIAEKTFFLAFSFFTGGQHDSVLIFPAFKTLVYFCLHHSINQNATSIRLNSIFFQNSCYRKKSLLSFSIL